MGLTLNMVGGGGSGKAVLAVAVTNGTATSVTATKSGVSVSLTDSGGIWSAELPSFGTWTVTITDGTHTNSATVNASTAGLYTVSIYMPDVPSAYTQLEYIGTARTMTFEQTPYIDTGVTPGVNTRFELIGKFIYQDTSSNEIYGSFGTQPGNLGGGIFLIHQMRHSESIKVIASLDQNNGINNSLTQEPPSNAWQKFVLSKSLLQLGNETLQNTNFNGNSIHVYIGKANLGWTGDWYGGLYVRTVYHYEGAQLMHKFIPAKRKSDSVVGMYEAVNGVFYAKTGGTLDFVAGSAIS